MGVMTVAGTTLVRSCTRYDSFHCLNTDANRNCLSILRFCCPVAYYYWVLAGVDILRRDANLFAKQRGNKTRKALMRERVWNKRFDEGYLCLGDWYEPFPGELRQHAITGTGKKVALTELRKLRSLMTGVSGRTPPRMRSKPPKATFQCEGVSAAGDRGPMVDSNCSRMGCAFGCANSQGG